MRSIFLLSLAVAGLAAAALPAEARTHGHVRSVQGAFGRGYVQSRHVSREPGAASVTRSLQTNGGRGYVSSRSRAVDDGVYTGGRTTLTNGGASFGRSTTAVNNGDGTASYATTFSGPNGGSRTVSGMAVWP